MMLIATVIQPSLSDPPQPGVLTPATNWIINLIFGQLATAIAVIAIAWVGFAMLSGRIDIRRGSSVLLGCFLLFGSRGIAEGLRSSATIESAPIAAIMPPSPIYAMLPPDAGTANGYDPYASAAVSIKK